MSKTAAEILVDALRKVSEAYQDLNKAGMPKSMIRAWLHQKTKVSLSNIDKIMAAMEELHTEMSAPMD